MSRSIVANMDNEAPCSKVNSLSKGDDFDM
jgi:hypothetical protein